MSPLPPRPSTVGRTVFITQVVADRYPVFAQDEHCELLLSTLRRVKTLYPFRMIAYCIMPDHLHLFVQLEGATTIGNLMHSLKRNYTINYKRSIGVEGRMLFWQKSFVDHLIRDDEDYATHLHYVHLNPVRQGLVRKPEDWRWSSYRAWQERGYYDEGWAWPLEDTMARIAKMLE